MNRTDRLYAIVEELRAAGARGRTAAALAGTFEVATRTVKRDVSALQQAGVPIWATGGPGGGYVLDAAATLPPITFTAAEATALALALAVQPGLPFSEDGRSALAKVLAVMPASGADAARDLAARTWVRPADRRAPVAVTRVLDEGLRHRRVLALDYTAAGGAVTAGRPVEPMAYALDEDRHWYLLAWCRLREGGRWFRLDRIDGARLTGDTFADRDLRATFGEPPADAFPVLGPEGAGPGRPAVRP
jgi:predicted DNA-binding transcriptional regulator YafY